MQVYTVEEFQQRWDEMIGRVESGERIGITNGSSTAVMVPTDDEFIRIYTELNNEAS